MAPLPEIFWGTFDQSQNPGPFMVGALREPAENLLGLLTGEAGHQDIFIVIHHPLHDSQDFGGLFALTEDDLGEASSQVPVMVDTGESQVFKGQCFKLLKGLVNRYFAITQAFKEIL